jgi:sugar phosphate isomerase/epimerase
VDFQKVRRAMDDIGYRGWIQLEAAAPGGIVPAYTAQCKFLKGVFPLAG